MLRGKKKIILVLCITALLLLTITIYRKDPSYIFIGRNLYKTNCTDLEVDFSDSNHVKSLKSLKYFKNVRKLDLLYCNRVEDFDNLASLKQLKNLEVYFSKIEDTSFVNQLSNITNIHLLEDEINLQNIKSKYLTTVDFVGCKIENLAMLKNCKSLTDVYICKGVSSGMKKEDNKYILYDSSDFVELDSVQRLDIAGMMIQDISGLLDMKQLEKLGIDKYSITSAQEEKLNHAGIKVYYDNVVTIQNLPY